MAVDVSIVSCKSYDAEECRTALTQALAPFGGLDSVSYTHLTLPTIGLV